MGETDFKRLSRQMSGREGIGGSTILVTIILLISAMLFWANSAEIDNVTRGEGRIVSSVQNQLVQAAEGGVLLRRYVSENTKVEKDEVLFEIDPVDASSDLNGLNQRLAALSIRALRLRAEIDGADFSIPVDLNAVSPTVALTEQSLFAARKAELSGTILVLEQRLEQRELDLSVAEAVLETSHRTAILLEDEIAIVAPLVSDNIAPATRLLELQRSLEQARGEQDQAKAMIDQSRSAMRETESEIVNAKLSYSLKSKEELNRVVAEQSELRESLPLLEERVSRTLIRAPMQGIVNRLNFRTPGAFVNTGDIVLELVPTDEDLVVEAKIASQDISNILPGDAVRIRFSAYDSAKYGAVEGRVQRISPDAVVDKESGGQSYYTIEVAIESDLLVDGKAVTFIPGMTATVDVLSGKRSVLEYFWQPMAKVQELALRD